MPPRKLATLGGWHDNRVSKRDSKRERDMNTGKGERQRERGCERDNEQARPKRAKEGARRRERKREET